MNLAEALQQHLLLIEQINLLFIEEQRILQTTRKPPTEEFLSRKRDLLPRLEAVRLLLLRSKLTQGNEISAQKAAIERLQKKMLALLLLDRENEKLLLKYSVQAEAFRVPVKPPVHHVTRAYSAAAA